VLHNNTRKQKKWLHVNFRLYSWLVFTHLNPLSPTADGCIFVWSLQNPRQSKSSASIDVPRTSQPPAPVPRLLLEEPDASELPPPPISARASRRKSKGRCCIACWEVNRTSQRRSSGGGSSSNSSSNSSNSSNSSHFTPICC